jgi:hypothetical protein
MLQLASRPTDQALGRLDANDEERFLQMLLSSVARSVHCEDCELKLV